MYSGPIGAEIRVVGAPLGNVPRRHEIISGRHATAFFEHWISKKQIPGNDAEIRMCNDPAAWCLAISCCDSWNTNGGNALENQGERRIPTEPIISLGEEGRNSSHQFENVRVFTNLWWVLISRFLGSTCRYSINRCKRIKNERTCRTYDNTYFRFSC